MFNIICINNDLLRSCSYIIEYKHVWLIDCGDCRLILDTISRIGKSLKAVFLTHCHLDHIYGLCVLLKFYPHVKIYCSEQTLKGLKDIYMNLSYIFPIYSFDFVYDDNVVILHEGIYCIDGLECEVIPTPGHADDCITYIIGNNIFTGDSYIPFAKIFARWPRSNKALALENEKTIKNIIKQRNLNVYSGHWKEIAIF